MDDLRYPIGHFQHGGEIAPEELQSWIEDVAELPGALRRAVADLSEAQLDTPYRPGGWTVRQVVHHLADANLDFFTRFKLTLIEADPPVKLWDQAGWADLPDAKLAPVAASLARLEGAHRRWELLLRSMAPADFERAYRHPDCGKVTLAWDLGLCAWHGRHHTAHIIALRRRMGW
jgi:uncharacterized damage-inducible protein DinB